jgi:hypothetical protein
MKVPVPESLKQRITESLAQLDSAIKADVSQRAEQAGKIAAYETEQGTVTAQITTLKGLILQDAGAVGKIPTLQLRAEALAVALSDLRGTLAAMEPVSLAPVTSVLLAVIDHYKTALPEAFADAVGDVFGTRASAIAAANNSDGRRYLNGLANRCYVWRSATADNVSFIKEILARALAGRPHLGVDIAPEPQPASQAVPATSA